MLLPSSLLVRRGIFPRPMHSCMRLRSSARQNAPYESQRSENCPSLILIYLPPSGHDLGSGRYIPSVPPSTAMTQLSLQGENKNHGLEAQQWEAGVLRSC